MFHSTQRLGSVKDFSCKSEERVEQFAHRDTTLDGKYFVSKDSSSFSTSLFSIVTQDQHQLLSAITKSILHPLKFLAILNIWNDSVMSIFINLRRRGCLLFFCAKQAQSLVCSHISTGHVTPLGEREGEMGRSKRREEKVSLKVLNYRHLLSVPVQRR